MAQDDGYGCGCFTGIGAGIAGTLSWLHHHSIWFAIVHGLFNWFYVVYRIYQYFFT